MQANISIDARANIVALRKNGLNIFQISTESGLCRNTVSRWVKRFEEEDSLKSRLRSGRPPLINSSQRRFMVEEYETNGFIPTIMFADQFDTTLETVRHALHAEGLHHRKPAKKPFLTQKHKEERLRFARDYLDFNWEATVFSDEKTFKSCQKEDFIYDGKLISRRGN